MFGRNKRPIRAYFQALWETGLRPETIVSIEAPRDYRRGSGTLRIRADADKARYAREVPLTPGAREALDSVCPEAGFLFPRAPDGDAPKVSNELRKAARLAGLAPDRANRISPYDLRHGRATELVHKTDLLSTSYLIGHKHASTTDRYIHGRKEMAVLALAKLAGGAALKPASASTSIVHQPHDELPAVAIARRAKDVSISRAPSSIDYAPSSTDDSPSSSNGAPSPREAPSSSDAQAASPDASKHDFGHTLATVEVLSESAARPPVANSAEPFQCEEQDLNLHTLRYRNLKVERPLLKHWIYWKASRQEAPEMARERRNSVAVRRLARMLSRPLS